MQNTLPTEKEIQTFVDAGSTNLKNYTFVSTNLNKESAEPPKMPLMPLVSSMALESDSEHNLNPDSEKSVEFRLNQTGNIFYSTTSPQIEEDTKKLFESITVLFAAMTKALAQKNKDLFDYDAWSSIISKSGYFIEVQKFETTLTIESNSLTIDTQVVQQLLPGLKSGSSMEIAKSVLSALNGKFSSQGTTDETKFGHLLFICEELFGSPSITVRLFFATKKSHASITSSSCHNTTSKQFSQTQEANTFLFVSPETIAKFADDFNKTPDSYNQLITTLSTYIS
jgi:hypothetical protein